MKGSHSSFENAVAKLRAGGERKSPFFEVVLNQMGLSSVQLFKIDEVAELFEEARQILEQECGPCHQDTLGVYSNLAATYDALGSGLWDVYLVAICFQVLFWLELCQGSNLQSVQNMIYPIYFKAMAYCVGPSFLGHFLSQNHRPYANTAKGIQDLHLIASISMLLINLLYLELRAIKVMFERLKLEKEEADVDKYSMLNQAADS